MVTKFFQAKFGWIRLKMLVPFQVIEQSNIPTAEFDHTYEEVK